MSKDLTDKELPPIDPPGYREELQRQLEELKQMSEHLTTEQIAEAKKKRRKETKKKYDESEKGKATRRSYYQRSGKK